MCMTLGFVIGTIAVVVEQKVEHIVIVLCLVSFSVVSFLSPLIFSLSSALFVVYASYGLKVTGTGSEPVICFRSHTTQCGGVRSTSGSPTNVCCRRS